MFVSVRMQFHNHVDQGLKHAAHEPHVAPEGILCGPQVRIQTVTLGGAISVIFGSQVS